MWRPDNEALLSILLLIITVCCSGGAVAGSISLIFVRRDNLFTEIFRLLIGAIVGYEAIVLLNIFSGFPKNVDEMLRVIVVFHTDIRGSSIPFILGAIGSYTAIFVIKRIVRSRQ